MNNELIERLRGCAVSLATERDAGKEDSDGPSQPSQMERDLLSAASFMSAASLIIDDQNKDLASLRESLRSAVDNVRMYRDWSLRVKESVGSLPSDG